MRDLGATASIDDLPPYIAEVVKAVAEGVQTSREFANVRGISISNARPGVGSVLPVDARDLPRQGICCTLNPARSSN